MNSSLLNNILLSGRVILPSIICSLTTLILMKTYWSYMFILTFSVIILLFNYRKIKRNFLASFFLLAVLSYTVFFLSIGIEGLTKYLFFMEFNIDKKVDGSILGIDKNVLLSLISIAIISPILMYNVYTIIFKIEKTNYYNYIKWISIILIIGFGQTRIAYKNNYDYMFMVWQFVMALALQLILYQKELKALFKPKNK